MPGKRASPVLRGRDAAMRPGYPTPSRSYLSRAERDNPVEAQAGVAGAGGPTVREADLSAGAG
jgi:hypothetical protein